MSDLMTYVLDCQDDFRDCNGIYGTLPYDEIFQTYLRMSEWIAIGSRVLIATFIANCKTRFSPSN